MKVILASTSPRRKELLSRLFSDFEIISSDVDESLPHGILPKDAPEYLAKVKGMAISPVEEDTLVIAADTVVIFKDAILGKPRDESEAFQTLSALSGNTHKVITGCFLRFGNRTKSFSVESEVSFYPISPSEIEEYIQSGEPMGKAGSYAIQGKGGLFAESIRGDYYNIVGLPIGKLKREIESLVNEK